MIKWLAFFAEFARFIVIFALGLAILGEVEGAIYSMIGVAPGGNMWWMAGLANVLLLQIVYRNRLQFSGWLKSPANRKLSGRTTMLLASVSLLLLLIASCLPG
ncbi:hypothetical protein [Paenibacillus piri]|uniref:Uncharacterized protein n=1 Tax=Paenibacillus piri TaxID=2547395 RepID=A0A4R5KSM3_9BACL|nr:hypothetical protein [Paenibacillus piri]TDF98616.1 hypothetical protein E1757_08715 [Paenibacillus piri]